MLEQWPIIGLVLCFLLACIDIYWLLVSGHIDIIRKWFAQWAMRNHRVESYIEGLRKLVEEKDVPYS